MAATTSWRKGASNGLWLRLQVSARLDVGIRNATAHVSDVRQFFCLVNGRLLWGIGTAVGTSFDWVSIAATLRHVQAWTLVLR